MFQKLLCASSHVRTCWLIDTSVQWLSQHAVLFLLNLWSFIFSVSSNKEHWWGKKKRFPVAFFWKFHVTCPTLSLCKAFKIHLIPKSDIPSSVLLSFSMLLLSLSAPGEHPGSQCFCYSLWWSWRCLQARVQQQQHVHLKGISVTSFFFLLKTSNISCLLTLNLFFL